VVNDLLGPAGGEHEELDESHLSELYPGGDTGAEGRGPGAGDARRPGGGGRASPSSMTASARRHKGFLRKLY
jgi:hypothetical protein